jgi:T-complex protein 1 subunit gamma
LLPAVLALLITPAHLLIGGEVLALAEPLLNRNFHPTVIVSGYRKALTTALDTCNRICRVIDTENNEELRGVVMSAIGTKFSGRWGHQMVDIAIQAVRQVVVKRPNYTEIDVKRYVRIEKIPGGELAECSVLNGVMFNKDPTHAKMRRRIENPRILLLDCPLEYKKGESQTNVEIQNEEDFNSLLRQEEEYIEQICAQVTIVRGSMYVF